VRGRTPPISCDRDSIPTLAKANQCGCSPGVRLDIAAACEAERPEEAIVIYRNQVEVTLQRTGNRTYDEAVTRVRKIGELFARVDRPGEFRRWLVEVEGAVSGAAESDEAAGGGEELRDWVRSTGARALNHSRISGSTRSAMCACGGRSLRPPLHHTVYDASRRIPRRRPHNRYGACRITGGVIH